LVGIEGALFDCDDYSCAIWAAAIPGKNPPKNSTNRA
jgi:hypothetical protein